MTVYLAGYQASSILRGGATIQLQNTYKYLRDFGIEARLFDPWTPFRPETCDLFHLFASDLGMYHLGREIHTLRIPMALSPITYSLHSHGFIRMGLGASRMLQRIGYGVWTDYAITSDLCNWSSLVLPNTRDEASLMAEGYGVSRDKIKVIPNGVDERFADADPTLFKKTHGIDRFILNVGHTGHVRKNVLALIHALARIDHPSVIIGRIVHTPYGEACLREAEKNKNILLLDSLDHDSAMLASAYAACDVFAMPSLFETPGIAALEAGLAGAKVVITPYGGTKDYFGTMADYVDPHSVESIRGGIVRALEKKQDEALRMHIRKEFLWPRVAEKTAAAYRTIVNR
jgi:glycosyltransferase involved in cell wall biosynthesis